MDRKIEELERLARLRDVGALIEAEFDAEKVRILRVPSSASAAVPEHFEFHWNPFRGSASREDAEALVRLGTWTAAAFVGETLMRAGVNWWDLAHGRAVVDGLDSNATMAVQALALLITLLLFGSLAWAVSARRGLASAWALVVLSALGLIGSLMQMVTAHNRLAWASAFLSGAGLFFALQALRGVLSLRGLGVGSERATASSASSALAMGLESSRPMRHFIRVAGIIGLLLLLLIGAFWFFKSEGDVERAQPAAAGESYPSQALLPATSSPDPAGISPPATLIESWLAAEERCRGGAGDDPATFAACDQRDWALEKLNAAGWCYGREGESNAEFQWHTCGPGSLGYRPR